MFICHLLSTLVLNNNRGANDTGLIKIQRKGRKYHKYVTLNEYTTVLLKWLVTPVNQKTAAGKLTPRPSLGSATRTETRRVSEVKFYLSVHGAFKRKGLCMFHCRVLTTEPILMDEVSINS